MMRRAARSYFLLATVAVVTSLAACAPAPTVEEAAPAPVAAKPSYKPMPNLTPRQRLLRSFELLEEGDADRARVELLAYLERVPSSALAKDLLLQIDTDPEVFYPAKYREITLQPGQSLSNVAKEYLGSAFDFYALARYNDIDRPRRVVPGQVVRVPLTPEAIAVFAVSMSEDGAATASSGSEESAEMIAGDADVSDGLDTGLGEALDELEAEVEDVSDAVVGASATEAATETATEAKTMADEMLEADEALAIEAAPGAGGVNGGEDSSEEAIEDTADAMASEMETAAADPEPQIDLDALHREAINAYRSQDLDRAIGLWDQILAVDPGYESARLYRSQAEALKERLKRLQ